MKDGGNAYHNGTPIDVPFHLRNIYFRCFWINVHIANVNAQILSGLIETGMCCARHNNIRLCDSMDFSAVVPVRFACHDD